MNIKEAKDQIKNAMTAYFTKNQFGAYVIPIEKQRPVFLMGPPGIGKTAIMEQVAQELGVGMIAYSMTHHTRQSALGLPFISKKIYGGHEYDISEYTMSEIIASVYDMIEETGNKEGILFLDEINCVSETLAPSMLQFLQYKIFGKHKVPDGWIVVTAGNPPENNNTVREFDIVKWDRLNRIDVEPDYTVWKEYAYKTAVHASIITYLDIKKGDFYKIETTVDGKSFVTARGWSDLSEMIKLYEFHKIKIDEKLIAQYVQNKKIAKDFAVYYDLFNKYKSDYQIDNIINGKVGDEIVRRAVDAKFDERLALLGLLIDGMNEKLRDVCASEMALVESLDALKRIKVNLRKNTDVVGELEKQIEQRREILSVSKRSGNLSSDKELSLNNAIGILEDGIKQIREKNTQDGEASFGVIKEEYEKQVKQLRMLVSKTSVQLNNIFLFCEKAFNDGQEMLILVTELTANFYSSRFIGRHGCDSYFKHNKELLFYERQKEIIRELENLDFE